MSENAGRQQNNHQRALVAATPNNLVQLTAQQTLSEETTITVALELAYKKFMNTAPRQYTRAVAKELNTYGALI